MGVFWCARHERMEDADEVGYVESHDGGAVCQEAQDEAEYHDEMRQMAPADRRYHLSGESDD